MLNFLQRRRGINELHGASQVAFKHSAATIAPTVDALATLLARLGWQLECAAVVLVALGLVPAAVFLRPIKDLRSLATAGNAYWQPSNALCRAVGVIPVPAVPMPSSASNARSHSEPAACIGQDADALPCLEPSRLRRRRRRDVRRWNRCNGLVEQRTSTSPRGWSGNSAPPTSTGPSSVAEIGHILGGHLAKMERQRVVGGILGAVLAAGLIASADDVPIGAGASVAYTAAQIGDALGKLRFSRMFELEADYIGAYMLARAGGDVNAAKAMWRRWGGMPVDGSWLSFHPSDHTRLAVFTAAAREVERKRDEGIALLPTVRQKEGTSKEPKYFSATLDCWDTNGNGRISCREARRQGIAPIPVGHPAWHYAAPSQSLSSVTRTGRRIERRSRARC